MRKENQFLQWLLGENVPFPFLQDLPEVAMPEGEHDHKDTCTDCEEVKEEEI